MMIRTKLFTVTLLSILCLSSQIFALDLQNPPNSDVQNSAAPNQPIKLQHQDSEVHPEPLTIFHPRLKNIYIAIDKTTQETQFSIVNIIQFAALTADKVYSLLKWQLKTSDKEVEITPYSRKEHFGGWVRNPKDKDCYNTRAKVLIRDSVAKVTFKENNCTVATGEWHDPYAGSVVTDAQEMQIDHMVPLKDAYISGAYNWTFKARCLYGNYLGFKDHLVSAYGEENNQKGDATPAEYMPPNKEFKCAYLKNWLFIKGLWGLSMSEEEAHAIQSEIKANNCSADQMVITEKELNEQAEFFQKNADLCRNVTSNDP